MEISKNEQASKPHKGRYFFIVMAFVFIIISILGFGSDYLMMINSTQMTAPHWFAKVHGAIMGTWLLVFLFQSVLAIKGNLKFHRQLGLFSIGLAVLVWLSIIVASVRAKIADPPPIDPMDGTWDIMLINLFGITMFGLFFTWGVLVRKNAAKHKRLLFFATAVLLQASVDRLRFLPALGADSNLVYLDVLLILPLFVYDFVSTRQIHKITIIGTSIIVVVQIAMATASGTSAWNKFCFNCFAPFVEKVEAIKLSDDQIAPILGNYGNKNDTIWHMTVYKADEKVYLKLPNVPEFEMEATSQNEWYLKRMVWKVSFIKDKNGRVVKMTNKQPGLLWEAERLKK